MTLMEIGPTAGYKTPGANPQLALPTNHQLSQRVDP
jgi:hypothetical protein